MKLVSYQIGEKTGIGLLKADYVFDLNEAYQYGFGMDLVMGYAPTGTSSAG